MLTHTWRHRLQGTHRAARRAGLVVGLASCSVVAIATIWGWIFDDPIDVGGPARSAVNRTALVGSYAQDCVTRWLTATAAHQQVLHDCFSLRDPIRLPTTPALIVTSPAVSAVTLVGDTGAAQQWSVVISVCERAFEAATPHTAYYRLPVVYSSYGLRASALPARVNGPGAGADAPLGYAAAVADTSPAFATVSGFITSFLTGAGGLERYVTTSSGLAPAADYHSAQVIKLVANHSPGERDVPSEGTTVHVLATVNAVTNQYAPLQLDYPIVLTVTSGRWSVSALDYAPLLAAGAELTPVIPTAAAPH
ncbi:conjugal transfer protein [Mycobacterium heidelbergense]|uniref:conjugal transfer protein n=1 Tax=Mycobacterium heidelbergense TaxID=53376 RepID=UPI003CF25A5A